MWVTFEFLRAHLPEIGFPWNLLGYPASANLGLLQITTITGIYGLSFLVAAFNALVAWFDAARTPSIARRLTILGASTAVILLVMLFTPQLVPISHPNHSARVVQPNFPEAQSYPQNWFQLHTADLDELDHLSLASQGNPVDLLIWPEAPAPLSMEDLQFAKRATSLAARFGHPFIAGTVEWRPLTDDSSAASHHALAPYNSAVMLDSHGRTVFTYDKIHLVPFGEYEPFPLIHRVVSSVSSEVGGFRKGRNYSVGTCPAISSSERFICYEAIFPEKFATLRPMVRSLFINISNDGWFGRSAAPQQHLLHGTRTRGRKSPVDAARHQQWHHRFGGSLWHAFTARSRTIHARRPICRTISAPTKRCTRASATGSLGCA